MMSAEHYRLVEAWMAGTLAEGEEQVLFNLAESDPELARLLDQQTALSAGIRADRAGLRAGYARYNGDALRAQVAALSRQTEPEIVAHVGGKGGKNSGVGKLVFSLLLVGGAALSIHLVASDPVGSGVPASTLQNANNSGQTVRSVRSQPALIIADETLPAFPNSASGLTSGADADLPQNRQLLAVEPTGAHHTESQRSEVHTSGSKIPSAAGVSSSGVGGATTTVDSVISPASSHGAAPPPRNPQSQINFTGEIEGNLPP